MSRMKVTSTTSTPGRRRICLPSLWSTAHLRHSVIGGVADRAMDHFSCRACGPFVYRDRTGPFARRSEG
jgi:hypothetical protein